MPKISVPTDLSNIIDINQFTRYCSVVINEMADLINGGMLPQDNFNTKLLNCNFPAPNVDTAFDHGLNRTPSNYITFGLDAALIVYDGATANTDKTIYLRASAAGNARMLIF